VTAVLLDGSAQAIAEAVRTGARSAREIAQETLSRIEARNSALGAFTDVTATRALAKADAIDAARARGTSLGPLAGAPFAVKNLFDVDGLPTRAGSKINRDRPPAKGDATMIARLEAAGAIHTISTI
jgi:Asp-tRNA(Asn)/Glu-tRNA(Gln) amidotransferase A subunit family amidase